MAFLISCCQRRFMSDCELSTLWYTHYTLSIETCKNLLSSSHVCTSVQYIPSTLVTLLENANLSKAHMLLALRTHGRHALWVETRSLILFPLSTHLKMTGMLSTICPINCFENFVMCTSKKVGLVHISEKDRRTAN